MKHGSAGRWVTVFVFAGIGMALGTTDVMAGDESEAAAALAQRVLGERATEFEFTVIPREDGQDVFEIESADGKATIRGSNGVAMASGLNWFLKYHCNASVSWAGDQLDLPDPLPVAEKIRITTPYQYRYHFNYCAFSYTMAWWDWARWEREIDWMALNGINMPLSVTGQEAVWQNVYRDFGLADDAIQAFFVGPAYLPFGWMGCMDGWGGPLSQSWIDAHGKLQKKIVARERELGMTPVLQGFTGHVPEALKEKFPDAAFKQLPSWCGFPGTCFVDPSDPLFVRVGNAFIEEQTRQFGTDHLYASDTFIEMSPPSDDPAFLAEMGRAVYDAMAGADPEAIWVMQGWIFVNNPKFWKPPQGKALLGAVPDDRMILLDLYCESRPVWQATEAFYGKPWVWCIIHDFGGNVNMFGKLSVLAEGPPAALASPDRGRMSGLGMIMEAIEQNPIVYDLMAEMTWRTQPPDLKEWVRDYARRRYGGPYAKAEEAWALLRETVYNSGGVAYPPLKLVDAWTNLQECAEDLGDRDTYGYDLINVGRQVLANCSGSMAGEAIEAYRAKDRAAFDTASARFLELIRDVDALVATRREFLLGRWTSTARQWGDCEDEKRHYEWNARNQITLWGPRDSVLHEYAHKQWAGLLDGFYLPRWEMFFERLGKSLDANRAFNADAFEQEVRDWEVSWTHGTESYSPEPQGDAIEVSRAMLAKYGPILAKAYKPETPTKTLTTGKPTTCSKSLPSYPAWLANDGCSGDTDRYWATDVSDDSQAWWQVDFEEPVDVGRVVVVGYYGDDRYYGFTVETSLDGTKWDMAADRRDNTEPSTSKGYTCTFKPRKARYLRVTQTHNSANTGRHLVEVMAFEK